MTPSQPHIPIQTLHLFPVLDNLLIALLRSLTPQEWHLPTIAKRWTVKDVASHLLDGNVRTLSFSRDNYFGETPEHIHSYTDLVAYLNHLNHSWTDAAKRISPQLLTELLVTTGKQYCEHLQTLNPFATAVFPVAWAGQHKSQNWFHIAREYTEKYIHQQQIREATGKQALFTKELFYPFIDTFMYALPYTYRNVVADTGTTVILKILTDIGGQWHIIKTENHWQLTQDNDVNANATVSISPGIAWKLFSKSITADDALNEVEISGNKDLGKVALQMVSVMA